MRVYIYGNYITPKYTLPTVPVSPSFTIYKWLTTNRLTRKSPCIYSPNFLFFIGLFNELKKDFIKVLVESNALDSLSEFRFLKSLLISLDSSN